MAGRRLGATSKGLGARTQIGARLHAGLYRELRKLAIDEGKDVQTMLDDAIVLLLKKHKREVPK